MTKLRGILENMFKELFNLSYKRTKLQAFGFYIVWTLIFMLIAGLVNALVIVLFTPYMPKNYVEGLKTANITAKYVVPICALVLTTSLSAAIIHTKRIFSVATLLLAVASVLITPLFGAFLGMIPLVALTTFDNKAEKQIEE